MPAESVVSIGLLKWLWVVIIIPAFVFLFKRQDKIKESTFTKEETKEHIKLKLVPVLDKLDTHTEVVRDNTASTRELSKSLNALSERLVRVEVVTDGSK